MIQSFDPILADNPKVLILGSMPSAKSLEAHQYYGHPRNQFWPILYRLLAVSYDSSTDVDEYDFRVRLAMKSGISIWDVIQTCERSGSLDSDIKDEIPNDLEDFLNQYDSIRVIVFNGGKAESSFRKFFKHIYKSGMYDFVKMPSTSPAYTLKFDLKLQAWSRLNDYI